MKQWNAAIGGGALAVAGSTVLLSTPIFWQRFCKEVPVDFGRQAAFLVRVFTEAEQSH